MKKILTIVFSALLITVEAFAQIDRTHAPEPGPAPAINIGKAASFTLSNGLKVFVVENHKTPTITAYLVLKIDPVQEKDKCGYISMAGDILRRGTTIHTKEELDKEIDFLGASVNTGSKSASCFALSKNFEKAFSLMSEVVLHPSFPASELAKMKKQALSGLAAAKDDPNSILENVSSVVTYGKNHPYGEVETEASVSQITLDDLKQYYHTYWKPNVAYLALVGDITKQNAEQLVKQYFDDWQKGMVPAHTYPVPQKPAKTFISLVNRPAAVQTNIEVADPVVLKPGEQINFPAMVMNAILGGGVTGWLFQDLREKHGYTYGAYSRLSNNPVVGSFSADAAVRTAVTDSALMRFIYQLKRIRTDRVSEVLLDSVKNTLSGRFALSLESPMRIAQFALNIAMYDMPEDYYKNYIKSIAAVTTQDVLEAARKYITPDRTNIVMVGNTKEFADKLSSFGNVKYYDNYGNEVAAPQSKAIPAGITATEVINHYLQAIGGTDKLKAVKDLSFHAQAILMGKELQIVQKFLLPDHYLMNMTMEDNSISKILIKGNEVSMSQMGQNIPVDDTTSHKLKEQSQLFPEMNYADGKYQLKLNGIESVNGADAYSMDITTPAGQHQTNYYDVRSGLKIREVTVKESPAGNTVQTIEMSDYRPVEGIKMPYHIVMDLGPQKLDTRVQEVKVNSGLSADDFQ